jgi:hypothetical protein
MLYFPSRHWPLRRSGRPAQTSFSAEIRQAKAFTPASSQRHRRAASQNRHSRCDETTNSATCCQSDSVRRGLAWRGATGCESVALRTADHTPIRWTLPMAMLQHVVSAANLLIGSISLSCPTSGRHAVLLSLRGRSDMPRGTPCRTLDATAWATAGR